MALSTTTINNVLYTNCLHISRTHVGKDAYEYRVYSGDTYKVIGRFHGSMESAIRTRYAHAVFQALVELGLIQSEQLAIYAFIQTAVHDKYHVHTFHGALLVMYETMFEFKLGMQ